MRFHNHHMIPKNGSYFGDELFSQREDPYYQVQLTVEGHACQHDVLYKVFGHLGDLQAATMLYGQANMSDESLARQAKGQIAGGLRGGVSAVESGQLAAAQQEAYKKTRKRVVLTKISTGEEFEVESLQEAARQIGGSAGALCWVIQGKRKSHKGFTARYLE